MRNYDDRACSKGKLSLNQSFVSSLSLHQTPQRPAAAVKKLEHVNLMFLVSLQES